MCHLKGDICIYKKAEGNESKLADTWEKSIISKAKAKYCKGPDVFSLVLEIEQKGQCKQSTETETIIVEDLRREGAMD